jgi:hypothetical protein
MLVCSISLIPLLRTDVEDWGGVRLSFPNTFTHNHKWGNRGYASGRGDIRSSKFNATISTNSPNKIYFFGTPGI